MPSAAREHAETTAAPEEAVVREGAAPLTLQPSTPAAALRLQRAIGNRACARMATAPKQVLSRYQVEGSFNWNDPVHEALTLVAIRRAMDLLQSSPTGLLGVDVNSLPTLDSKDAHNLEPKNIDPTAQQFVRGVVWPDDPKGWLFDDDATTKNYSSGAKWYGEFDAKYKDQPDKLIGRSHYGDLQYFHGMASADGEAAQVTKDKILGWARFLIDVATGRIAGDAKLKDVAYTKDRFASYPEWTIKRLFVYEKGSDLAIRQRAAGALMHLIQDGHAKGHVERNAANEVLEFHSYEHQDHDEHGHLDAWGKGKTLEEHIKATPGAATAIEKCAQVLVMLQEAKPTDEIVKYIDEDVFKLAAGATASGPGAEFKKKPKPAPPREHIGNKL